VPAALDEAHVDVGVLIAPFLDDGTPG